MAKPEPLPSPWGAPQPPSAPPAPSTPPAASSAPTAPTERPPGLSSASYLPPAPPAHVDEPVLPDEPARPEQSMPQEPAPPAQPGPDGPAKPDQAESFSWSSQAASPALPPMVQAGSAPAAPPTPAAPAAATWIAVVTSDRTYYDRMQVERAVTGPAVPFPVYNNERRFPLAGNQMRIGRRSAARGLEPEIDLAGPPADPGVSRLHAVLIASPDGTWGVLDPGSANGTRLNGRPISIGNLIPLRDGDRINLGAWTAITVHRG